MDQILGFAKPPEPAGWWVAGSQADYFRYQLPVSRTPRRLTRWAMRLIFEFNYKPNPKA